MFSASKQLNYREIYSFLSTQQSVSAPQKSNRYFIKKNHPQHQNIMLQKTRGLVLKLTPYADSSVIAHIYTEDLGLLSFLIQGAKKSKARIHINILQPLHILDLVIYYKESNQLLRIKEARLSPTLIDIPLNIVKSSLAIFINEILYKVLKHQQSDPRLFAFLVDSVTWLDHSRQKDTGNFHLVFLLELTKHLGFYPQRSNAIYFDLMEGLFTPNIPKHPHFIPPPYTEQLLALLNSDFDSMKFIMIEKRDRMYILEKILDYYRLHTENFGEAKSLAILREIFA